MTTPRNIKASVINDLRTYAIHRKHMEKSEMSEVKDYGDANDTNNSAALQIKTYRRRPVTVEAVQVTESNMEAVAEWCGGLYRNPMPFFSPHIEIRRNTCSGVVQHARPDSWITRDGLGEYATYYEDEFDYAFEEVSE